MRYYHINLDGKPQMATWSHVPVQILAWSEREAEKLFKRDPRMCGSGLRRVELKGRTVEATPAPTSPDVSA